MLGVFVLGTPQDVFVHYLSLRDRDAGMRYWASADVEEGDVRFRAVVVHAGAEVEELGELGVAGAEEEDVGVDPFLFVLPFLLFTMVVFGIGVFLWGA